mmetsp:Transcript_44111/g.73218  ORF Transcript_44111/g.73218 Transcript_44111/m.73218 type:complete len:173 (+) Transcript_44111:42-560(+)
MDKSSNGQRTVFVTVGTTEFDVLVQKLLSDDVLSLLAQQGFDSLCLQIGRGSEPTIPECPPLAVKWYRFKNSLESDMHNAALLISHAGAGSILEGLRCPACLLVVVNDKLMHNHQQELAHELADRGHLLATTPNGLFEALRAAPEQFAKLQPLPASDPSLFPRFLTSQLGLS